MKPTNNDPRFRTFNREVPAMSAQDKYVSSTWRAQDMSWTVLFSSAAPCLLDCVAIVWVSHGSNGTRGERPETHPCGDRVVRQVEDHTGRQLVPRLSTTSSYARGILGRLFRGTQPASYGAVGVAQK